MALAVSAPAMAEQGHIQDHVATPAPCVLDAESTVVSLAPCAERRIAPTEGTTPEALFEGGAFVPVGPNWDVLGYGNAEAWYRIRLRGTEAAPRTWIVDIGQIFLDRVDLYVRAADGRVTTARVGDRVPVAQRLAATPGYGVLLDIAAGETVTILARVVTDGTLAFDATAWDTLSYLEHTQRSAVFTGIFIGVLALAFLIYAVVGTGLRDTAMLTYTVFLGSLIGLTLGTSGVWVTLVPAALTVQFDTVTRVSGLLSAIMLLVFPYAALDLRRTFPWVGRLYLTGAALTLASLPFADTPLYAHIAPPVFVIGATGGTISLLLAAVLVARRYQRRESQIYVVGFLVVAVGGWARILLLFGFLPVTPFILNSYQAGTLVHVVIMAIALAERLRRVSREREAARQLASQARERERDQRRLVAMLSHEFRAPLAGLKTAAETVLLTTPDLAARTRERLTRIVSRAGGLLDLFQRFLDAEALGEGHLSPDRARVSPAALAARLRARLDGHPEEARVQINTQTAPPIMALDPALMEQALGNLVDNALRFAPGPDPVALTMSSRTGGGVRLEVQDSGPGMTAGEVAELGTRYFRGATARGTRGTGLGLYLTRRIVAAHGGTLSFDTAPGAGTRAIIDLPDDSASLPDFDT